MTADSTTDEIVFDSLDLIEVPVTLAGKKYVLIEADGETAAGMKNRIIRSSKVSDEGKVTLGDGIADAEAFLVGQCLYRDESGGRLARTRIGEATVRSWPARVVKALYERARQISGLDDDKKARVAAGK